MASFVEEENGALRVFEDPRPDMVYTVGIDASTGLAEDYTVMQVLTNSVPFRQVAIFRAKWPVNQISEMADKLGRWYNTAMIICEINYPGNSVQDALLQYYQYPRNYQAEQHLDEDPNISPRYGFRMTEPNKWMLIRELQEVMNNREIRINDKTTLYELLNYVYQTSRAKAGAAQGFNDDCVVSLMLALHAAKLYPFLAPLSEKPKTAVVNKNPDAVRDWRLFRERLQARAEGREHIGIVL